MQLQLSSLTVLNSLACYSLFVEPVLQGTFLGLFVNPFLLLPSLLFNIYQYRMNKIYFFAQRSMCINMFLAASGKQIFVETLDGDLKKINVKDIYSVTKDLGRGERDRIDVKYGTGQYFFIMHTQAYFMDHLAL